MRQPQYNETKKQAFFNPNTDMYEEDMSEENYTVFPIDATQVPFILNPYYMMNKQNNIDINTK